MAGEFSTDFMNNAPTDFKSLGDYDFSILAIASSFERPSGSSK